MELGGKDLALEIVDLHNLLDFESRSASLHLRCNLIFVVQSLSEVAVRNSAGIIIIFDAKMLAFRVFLLLMKSCCFGITKKGLFVFWWCSDSIEWFPTRVQYSLECF